MTIAILVHCFYPRYFYGTEAYALSLAKEFIRAGHDATVITASFQGDPAQAAPIARRGWEDVPVISLDKNAWPHASVRETYDQPALREVHAEILGALKPDVLHVCHLINHTAAVIDAAKALNIPVYATLTDLVGFCLTTKLEAADRLNKAYAQAVAGLREELERKDKELRELRAVRQISVKVGRAQLQLARRQRTHRLPSHHLRLRTREVRKVFSSNKPL